VFIVHLDMDILKGNYFLSRILHDLLQRYLAWVNNFKTIKSYKLLLIWLSKIKGFKILSQQI